MNRVYKLSLLTLLLILGACSNDAASPVVPDDPSVPRGVSPVSGLVTAPTGGDVTGVEIIACLEPMDRVSSVDCAFRVSYEVTQTGQSAPYFFEATGESRLVYAFKDVNNNGFRESSAAKGLSVGGIKMRPIACATVTRSPVRVSTLV